MNGEMHPYLSCKDSYEVNYKGFLYNEELTLPLRIITVRLNQSSFQSDSRLSGYGHSIQYAVHCLALE